MTEDEFKTCFRHHMARNANVASWFDKQNVRRFDPNDLKPIKSEIADGWRHTWIELDFNAVMKAIDRFADGDEQFSDKGFDCHPKDIRRSAKGSVHLPNRFVPTDGQPTVKCLICEDSGNVTAWSDEVVKWARDMAMSDFPDFDEEIDIPLEELELAHKLPHLCGPPGQIPTTRTRTLDACPQWRDAVQRKNMPIRRAMLCNCDAGKFKRYEVKIQMYNPSRHLLYDWLNPKELVEFSRNSSAGVDFCAANGIGEF